MLGVKVEGVAVDWVNAVLHQTVPGGPPSAASGAIARPLTSQMGTQMLANVAPPQTVQTGLQLAPSGDTVRRMEVLEVKLVPFQQSN